VHEILRIVVDVIGVTEQGGTRQPIAEETMPATEIHTLLSPTHPQSGNTTPTLTTSSIDPPAKLQPVLEDRTEMDDIAWPSWTKQARQESSQ